MYSFVDILTAPVTWIALLLVWLAVLYVYGRWWTWSTNRKRRASYRRRR